MGAVFVLVARRIGVNDKALEIGTSSGYQAAMLAEFTREVDSIVVPLRPPGPLRADDG